MMCLVSPSRRPPCMPAHRRRPSARVASRVQCKMRRTYFSKRCKDLGHEQKRVKATLRFFECTNCRKRRSCTERMPQTGCDGCGAHNSWKRCGARPGRGQADGPRDKRFVTAVSEVGGSPWSLLSRGRKAFLRAWGHRGLANRVQRVARHESRAARTRFGT